MARITNIQSQPKQSHTLWVESFMAGTFNSDYREKKNREDREY